MSSKASSLISFVTLIILIAILYVAGFESTKKQQEIVKLQIKIQQLKKQNENLISQSEEAVAQSKEQISLVNKTLEENKAVCIKKEKELVSINEKEKEHVQELTDKVNVLQEKLTVMTQRSMKVVPVKKVIKNSKK